MKASVQNIPLKFCSAVQGRVSIHIYNISGIPIYYSEKDSQHIWEEGIPIDTGLQKDLDWSGDLYIGINPDQGKRADFVIVRSATLT